jgi:hypothetical protein
VIEKTDHNYEFISSEDATCAKTGKEVYTCKDCGAILTVIISKLSHTFVTDAAVAATCKSEGKTEGSHCSNCGYVKKEQTTIAKKDHAYTTVVVPATLSKEGSKKKLCQNCGEVASTVTIARPKEVVLSAYSYVYDGKEKKPSVYVTGQNSTRLSTDSYDVTYSSGCRNVGEYSVTVKFKGEYSGTITRTYVINPTVPKSVKAVSGKKSLTVKWKKISKQISGYQIRYSTSKKFKNAKTVTIKNIKVSSKMIKKLSAKKKYYVQVRSFKNVGGKKYYSDWSKAVVKKTK